MSVFTCSILLQTQGKTKKRIRYLNTACIFDNIKETLVYLRRDDILAIFKDLLSF